MSTLTLYPSNWLYNASVIGFLRVNSGEINSIEDCLMDDGSIKLDMGIFSDIEIGNKKFPKCLKHYIDYIVADEDLNELTIKIDKIEKYRKLKEDLGDFASKFIRARGKICGSNTIYQNLIQETEWISYEFVELVKGQLRNYPNISSEENCFLCGNSKVLKPESKLQKRLFMLQEPHLRLLAPSIGEFPNAFWNLNTSLMFCPLCVYLLIHHHIPFKNAKTQDGEIFINAPSFKVMWYLNKFAEKVLSKNKRFQLKEILGISFLEFAQRVSMTLGAWSMMNIEMIIIKRKEEKIEYYSLPFEISRVLLQKEIASLISETKEPIVLETILNGNFDYLITLSHKILRYAVTDSNASKDKYLSQLKNKDSKNLKNLARILPELYTKIDSITKEVMI